MKHKMDSGWTKYLQDKNKKFNHGKEDRIELLVYEEDMIQIKIAGSKPEDVYIVSCNEGFWRCDCVDWNMQFGKMRENKEFGSYCCKHIELAHYFIADLKGVTSQMKLQHNTFNCE